jgi:polyisoprenoid-binding protein YceI
MKYLIHILLIFIFLSPAFLPAGMTQSHSQPSMFKVDTQKSRLEWICGGHNGIIKIHRGNIQVADGEITSGAFAIAMDSITTLNIDYYLMRETLNNLLKSNHYFDTEKYPLSEFTITKSHLIEANNHCVTGKLRIKDQTHPITFHTNVRIDGDQLITKSEKFYIDRTRWGITTSSEKYVKDNDTFTFSDEIYFVVHLVATKQ